MKFSAVSCVVVKMMILILVLIVPLSVSASDQSAICSTGCFCPNEVVVNCSGLNWQKLIEDRDSIGKKVQILDFSNNNFTTIDNEFCSSFKLLNISHLDFSESNISKIHEHAFAGMNNLLILNLSKNNLTKIAEKLFANCPKLSHLFLSENNILSISSLVFTGLVNLVELDLSHNKIKSVMYGSFDDLVNLRILQLSNNYIGYISRGLFDNQRNMTFLDISNNNLSTLTSLMFARCSSLKNLSLSRNSISEVKVKAFLGITMLTALDLSENIITEIEVDAFNFSKDKSKMGKTLNSSSTKGIKLEYLNLSKNKLSEFSLELHFPELANGSTLFVDLSYNELKTFDSDSVTWLDAHHSVSLDYTGNPWDCTCDNSEMRMAYSSLKDSLSLNCTTPESVKGIFWNVLEDCGITTVSSNTMGDSENVSMFVTSSVTEVTNETEAKEQLFIGSFFLRTDVLVNIVYACFVFIASIIILIRNYHIHRPEDQFWWEDKLAKRSY